MREAEGEADAAPMLMIDCRLEMGFVTANEEEIGVGLAMEVARACPGMCDCGAGELVGVV